MHLAVVSSLTIAGGHPTIEGWINRPLFVPNLRDNLPPLLIPTARMTSRPR